MAADGGTAAAAAWFRAVEADLTALAAEARRTTPSVKDAAERVLAELRRVAPAVVASLVPPAAHLDVHRHQAVLSQCLHPFILAANHHDAPKKMLHVSFGSLQRFVNADLVPATEYSNIVRVLEIQCEHGEEEVRLRVLQQLPLLLSRPAHCPDARLLATLLSLAFGFLRDKAHTIKHAASATIQQTTALMFERTERDVRAQLQAMAATAAASPPPTTAAGAAVAPSPPAPPLLVIGTDSVSVTAACHAFLQDCVLVAGGLPPQWLRKTVPVPRVLVADLLDTVLQEHTVLFHAVTQFRSLLTSLIVPLLLRQVPVQLSFPLMLRFARMSRTIIVKLHEHAPAPARALLSFLIRVCHASAKGQDLGANASATIERFGAAGARILRGAHRALGEGHGGPASVTGGTSASSSTAATAGDGSGGGASGGSGESSFHTAASLGGIDGGADEGGDSIAPSEEQRLLASVAAIPLGRFPLWKTTLIVEVLHAITGSATTCISLYRVLDEASGASHTRKDMEHLVEALALLLQRMLALSRRALSAPGEGDGSDAAGAAGVAASGAAWDGSAGIESGLVAGALSTSAAPGGGGSGRPGHGALDRTPGGTAHDKRRSVAVPTRDRSASLESPDGRRGDAPPSTAGAHGDPADGDADLRVSARWELEAAIESHSSRPMAGLAVPDAGSHVQTSSVGGLAPALALATAAAAQAAAMTPAGSHASSSGGGGLLSLVAGASVALVTAAAASGSALLSGGSSSAGGGASAGAGGEAHEVVAPPAECRPATLLLLVLECVANVAAAVAAGTEMAPAAGYEGGSSGGSVGAGLADLTHAHFAASGMRHGGGSGAGGRAIKPLLALALPERGIASDGGAGAAPPPLPSPVTGTGASSSTVWSVSRGTMRGMADALWRHLMHALTATLVTVSSASSSASAVSSIAVYVLRAYQALTYACGVLELDVPRDALLINLCQQALPHWSPTPGVTSLAVRLLGTDYRPPGTRDARLSLSAKHVAALKTLFNMAHCLGDVLGVSWVALIDTFAQFERLLRGGDTVATSGAPSLLQLIGRGDSVGFVGRGGRRHGSSTATPSRLPASAAASGDGSSGALPPGVLPYRSNPLVATAPIVGPAAGPSAYSASRYGGASRRAEADADAPDDDVSVLAVALATLFESTVHLSDSALREVVTALAELTITALADTTTAGVVQAEGEGPSAGDGGVPVHASSASAAAAARGGKGGATAPRDAKALRQQASRTTDVFTMESVAADDAREIVAAAEDPGDSSGGAVASAAAATTVTVAPLPAAASATSPRPGAARSAALSGYGESVAPPFALVRLLETCAYNAWRLGVVWPPLQSLIRVLARCKVPGLRTYALTALTDLIIAHVQGLTVRPPSRGHGGHAAAAAAAARGSMPESMLLAPLLDFWASPHAHSRREAVRAVTRIIDECGASLHNSDEATTDPAGVGLAASASPPAVAMGAGGWSVVLGLAFTASCLPLGFHPFEGAWRRWRSTTDDSGGASDGDDGAAAAAAGAGASFATSLAGSLQEDETALESQLLPLAFPMHLVAVPDTHVASLSDDLRQELAADAFAALEAVCDEYLDRLSTPNLASLVLSLCLFARQSFGLNLALAAVGKLWKIADSLAHGPLAPAAVAAVRARTPTTPTPTPLPSPSGGGATSGGAASPYATALHLWSHIHYCLVSLCHGTNDVIMPRLTAVAATSQLSLTWTRLMVAAACPEVRNSAVQVLFQMLVTHAHVPTNSMWHHIVHSRLLPLIYHLTTVAQVYVADDDKTAAARVHPAAAGRGSMIAPLHHTRDTLGKQWNETRVLAYQGLTRLVSVCFGVFARLPWFNEVWTDILAVIERSIIGTKERSEVGRGGDAVAAADGGAMLALEAVQVSVPAVKCLQEMALLVVVPSGVSRPVDDEDRYSFDMRVVDGALVRVDSEGDATGQLLRSVAAAAAAAVADAASPSRSPSPTSFATASTAVVTPARSAAAAAADVEATLALRSSLWQYASAVLQGVCEAAACLQDDDENVIVALIDCITSLVTATADDTVGDVGAGSGVLVRPDGSVVPWCTAADEPRFTELLQLLSRLLMLRRRVRWRIANEGGHGRDAMGAGGRGPGASHRHGAAAPSPSALPADLPDLSRMAVDSDLTGMGASSTSPSRRAAGFPSASTAVLSAAGGEGVAVGGGGMVMMGEDLSAPRTDVPTNAERSLSRALDRLATSLYILTFIDARRRGFHDAVPSPASPITASWRCFFTVLASLALHDDLAFLASQRVLALAPGSRAEAVVLPPPALALQSLKSLVSLYQRNCRPETWPARYRGTRMVADTDTLAPGLEALLQQQMHAFVPQLATRLLMLRAALDGAAAAFAGKGGAGGAGSTASAGSGGKAASHPSGSALTFALTSLAASAGWAVAAPAAVDASEDGGSLSRDGSHATAAGETVPPGGAGAPTRHLFPIKVWGFGLGGHYGAAGDGSLVVADADRSSRQVSRARSFCDSVVAAMLTMVQGQLKASAAGARGGSGESSAVTSDAHLEVARRTWSSLLSTLEAMLGWQGVPGTPRDPASQLTALASSWATYALHMRRQLAAIGSATADGHAWPWLTLLRGIDRSASLGDAAMWSCITKTVAAGAHARGSAGRPRGASATPHDGSVGTALPSARDGGGGHAHSHHTLPSGRSGHAAPGAVMTPSAAAPTNGGTGIGTVSVAVSLRGCLGVTAPVTDALVDGVLRSRQLPAALAALGWGAWESVAGSGAALTGMAAVERERDAAASSPLLADMDTHIFLLKSAVDGIASQVLAGDASPETAALMLRLAHLLCACCSLAVAGAGTATSRGDGSAPPAATASPSAAASGASGGRERDREHERVLLRLGVDAWLRVAALVDAAPTTATAGSPSSSSPTAALRAVVAMMVPHSLSLLLAAFAATDAACTLCRAAPGGATTTGAAMAPSPVASHATESWQHLSASSVVDAVAALLRVMAWAEEAGGHAATPRRRPHSQVDAAAAALLETVAVSEPLPRRLAQRALRQLWALHQHADE